MKIHICIVRNTRMIEIIIVFPLDRTLYEDPIKRVTSIDYKFDVKHLVI